MLPSILRQASQFILAQSQPEYSRFLYDEIDFSERLICVKGAMGAGKTKIVIDIANNHSKIRNVLVICPAIDCDRYIFVNASSA